MESAFHKAESQDRDTLLARKSTTDNAKTFYLISTHLDCSRLNKSKTTRALNNAQLVFGKRRNKNLSDQLVRASTKTTDSRNHNIDTFHCNRSKTCRYCPMLDKTGTLRSTSTGKKFQSVMNVYCQSQNLSYLWHTLCRTNQKSNPNTIPGTHIRYNAHLGHYCSTPFESMPD